MDWFDIVCLWFGRIIILGSASLFILIWLFMYVYVKVARTKTGRAYLRMSKYIEKTYDKYLSPSIFLSALYPTLTDKVDNGSHICRDNMEKPISAFLCSTCRGFGENYNGNSMVSESESEVH